MTSNQRCSLSVRLLRPIVLAVGMCLVAGGCGTIQNSGGRPLDSAGMIFSGLGLNSKDKAFRKRVEADPFPEAGPGGL